MPFPDALALRAHAATVLPLPGRGQSVERLAALTGLGRLDLCLAKLVEPHHDATAICADLGQPLPEQGSLWEVWAAQPPGSGPVARQVDERWRLDGTKPFCSGATLASHALLTARLDGGDPGPDRSSRRWGLFAVDLDAARADETVRAEPASWVGPGMASADTRAVAFHATTATAVALDDAYVERAGFWHGAIGIAACWTGGLRGVAATLLDTARRRPLNPHALAHLGAVTAAVDRCAAVLAGAAAGIDAAAAAGVSDLAADRRRAESVRATVVAAAEEVITRVGHALGPGPLALDAEHAHRVADLQVFVRQHHAEADLAALGALITEGDERW